MDEYVLPDTLDEWLAEGIAEKSDRLGVLSKIKDLISNQPMARYVLTYWYSLMREQKLKIELLTKQLKELKK